MLVLIVILNLLAVIYCSIQYRKSGKNYLYVVAVLVLTLITLTYRLVGII